MDKFIRRYLFVLGLFLLLSLMVPTKVKSESPPPHGLLPFPEMDQTADIQLTAFVVDAYFYDEQSTWRILVRFRLYNPSKTDSARLRVHLQGLLPDGTPITEISGGEGYTDNPTTPFPQLTFERTLHPEERVWYTFLYTGQAPSTPWIRFSYSLGQLTAWPDPVGSVRVTVHMETVLEQHAYLYIHPSPTQFNGQNVEWQWENRTPNADTELLFIRPQTWAQIEQWRERTRQKDERAIESLAKTLTEWVTHPEAPDEIVRTFYPEALALWTQLAHLRPADPTPWQFMVTLYRTQAQRTHDENTYRPLILTALREAWKRGDQREETRQQLATLTQAQIDYLLRSHRWQEALEQLNTFADLLGPQHQSQISHLRQQIALEWAQERLGAQDWEGVRTALKAGWGKAILAYFQPQGPTFHYLSLEVYTVEQTRTITITAALNTMVQPPGDEVWNNLLSLVPTALPQASMNHERQGHIVRMRLDLPFATAEDLREQQRRFVGILPDTPEWEPIRNALNPRFLRRTEHTTLWGWTTVWEEEVDLTPAQERLSQNLKRLQATLTTPPTPDFPQDLYPVLRAFRAADIEAWTQFMEHINIVYKLKWTTPPGPPEARQWRVHLGEHLVMQAERPMIAPVRLAAIIGVLLLAWTAVSLLLWRALS